MGPKRLFPAVFLLFITQLGQAQAPEVHGVPTGWCIDRAGHVVRCSSAPAPYVDPNYKSPAELKKEKEAKDLREAAEDANDKGIEFYKNGDWDNAIKSFKEALEYDPDNDDMRNNLDWAMRKSEAARQLKSVEYHSNQAKNLSNEANKKESGKGFDTGGKPAGSITVPAVNAGSGSHKDPVVPPGKRTPAIAALENQRAASRKELSDLEEKLKGLDPKKDAVEVSKIKQKENTVENKINYLNFSITEALKKPKETTPSKSAN